jgi:phospholipase C
MSGNPSSPSALSQIQHVIVLMLENRSFDHLLGFRKTIDPRIDGLNGIESNLPDPNFPTLPAVPVSRATSFTMPFDPGHEFDDVQIQLYGPNHEPTSPAPMTGFIASAKNGAQQAKVAADAPRIMECFQPDQTPVLSALAAEFAVFNYWHSSLPGPTWPNRFFVHAATSGGLTDSPEKGQILVGFSFTHGTIYDRLAAAGKEWRIYHDGLPQTAGISTLRLEYVDPFTQHFRDMSEFSGALAKQDLPEYVFIEPNYDTGHNYQQGNSMHPLNDIRKGEALVKQVYEALRSSFYWDKAMLVITFDEHGGFYDHVPPPATVATGDDARYANHLHPFKFELLGVRVPAMVISAFTGKGLVIGAPGEPADDIYDHASLLATVEKRFGLPPMTGRDGHAKTLEAALNLAAPRTSPEEAPMKLPDPVPDSMFARVSAPLENLFSSSASEPLSGNQRSQLALALACDLAVTPPDQHAALHARHDSISTQREADVYIQKVDAKIRARRTESSKPGAGVSE